MKRLLPCLFLVMGLLVRNTADTITISQSYWGKGPLKISARAAEWLVYYFSSGKKGRHAEKKTKVTEPYFFMITADGQNVHFYMHCEKAIHYL